MYEKCINMVSREIIDILVWGSMDGTLLATVECFLMES